MFGCPDIINVSGVKMLNKIAKSCLIAAITFSLAAPAMAADPEVKVSGEVEAGIAQTTEKDGPTVMDMSSSAYIAVEGSVKTGALTTSGIIDFEITDDGFGALNRILTVENESVSFSMGNYEYDADDIGMGKDYLSFVDESLAAFGSNALEDGAGNGGGDYAKVSLKDAGLTVVVGINDLSEADGDATDDAAAYSETAFGAYYSGAFGDLSLSAAVLSVSEKVDEKQDATAVDGAHDGASKSEMAVAVGYKMGEMGFALNFDQYTKKFGDDSDDAKQMAIELVLDLGLGGESGITATYGTTTLDDGTDEKTQSTAMNIGYARPVGAATLTVGYAATTEKDDDDDTDTSNTVVGAGLIFSF